MLLSLCAAAYKRWQDKPLDFWLQLACCLFFPLTHSRGAARVLGVAVVLLQWYQCCYFAFLTVQGFNHAKGAAFAIVGRTLTTSQAITYTLAVAYFWYMDFVPFQGCSLPCLIFPRPTTQNSQASIGRYGSVRSPGQQHGTSSSVTNHGQTVEPSGGQFATSQNGIHQSHPASESRQSTGSSVLFDTEEGQPLLENSGEDIGKEESPGRFYVVDESAGLLKSRPCSRPEREKFTELYRLACLKANIFLLVGCSVITIIAAVDISWERFFDGAHIRRFLRHRNDATVALHWLAVIALYWGMYGVITFCCLFFCCTRSMIAAISEFGKKTITPEVDLPTAIATQRRLLEHIGQMIQSVSLWFIIHNISFIVLFLASIYWWVAVTVTNNDKEHVQLFVSVVATCTAIAFKFAFPMWAASRVTHYWKRQVAILNLSQEWWPGRCQDHDVLMNFISRSEGGFVIGSIKISDSYFLSFLLLLGSFMGLLRTLHVVKY